MKITFDSTIKLAGIGMSPWTRLGLEQWFPRYKIIALDACDAGNLANVPPILELNNVNIAKQNTQHLVRTDAFKNVAIQQLPGYSFLTYNPVTIDDPDLRHRFIMQEKRFAMTYENKAWLRETFGDQLPFASHQIVDLEYVRKTSNAYKELASNGVPFVLQHEQLSGGKGTFIIKTDSDLTAALASLPAMGKLVISSYVDGAVERSIQCVMTRHGLIRGPLQKQIVRHPALCNLGKENVNAFCGAEVGTITTSPDIEQKIAACLKEIELTMRRDGYKGIFGIDFLIRGNELYVLEINARLTGVTPLLTALYQPDRDIPFVLLHALELSGAKYSIDYPVAPQQCTAGSLMILQSHEREIVRLDRTVDSGVYRLHSGTLQLVRKDARFAASDPSDVFIVQQYVPPQTVVKPGSRVAAVLSRRAVTDANDQLTSESLAVITALYNHISFAAL